VPIKDAIEEIPVDAVVIAIGNGSNPIISQTTPELIVNKWGNILVDESNMKTNMKGIFAGGDIVTGGATVILAMGAGRTASKAIDEYLKNPESW
jgi:glutamate synthase (NADPH/NADH) small chain